MMQGPVLSGDDPGMGVTVSLERQVSFERKLSEFAGYAMLAAAVLVLGYGVFRVFV